MTISNDNSATIIDMGNFSLDTGDTKNTQGSSLTKSLDPFQKKGTGGRKTTPVTITL